MIREPAGQTVVVRLRTFVGDVVLSVPALRLLEQRGYRLQLIGKGWARSLLEAEGWTDTDGDGTRDIVKDGAKKRLNLQLYVYEEAENSVRVEVANQIKDMLKAVGINVEVTVGLVKPRVSGFDGQGPTVRHRIPGIDCQVDQNLVDLRRINLD